MRITIIGPRSVGKSSVSKILAEKLGYRYFEGDALANKELRKYGGLDKVIKENKFHLLGDLGTKITKEIMQKDNFVFDLAGGAISSRKKELKSSVKDIKYIIYKKSILIGLLPCKNKKEAVEFLFEREKNRLHFKNEKQNELLRKVKEDYEKLLPILNKLCKYIVYVNGKSLIDIVSEIESKIRLDLTI